MADWSNVRARDSNAEAVGAKLRAGIKDYELWADRELIEALWKARFVCTGNHTVGVDVFKVWHVDRL